MLIKCHIFFLSDVTIQKTISKATDKIEIISARVIAWNHFHKSNEIRGLFASCVYPAVKRKLNYYVLYLFVRWSLLMRHDSCYRLNWTICNRRKWDLKFRHSFSHWHFIQTMNFVWCVKRHVVHCITKCIRTFYLISFRIHIHFFYATNNQQITARTQFVIDLLWMKIITWWWWYMIMKVMRSLIDTNKKLDKIHCLQFLNGICRSHLALPKNRY